MWVTRALKTTQIAHLFVGISVHEASHLKGGVYSFLPVYNMFYIVKETTKECENGIQKKVWGHFLIKSGLELTLLGYDIVN